MTRALDATQSALVYKQQLARLDLVKLTTYSDRPAATVSQTFYFAKQALRYDYGNTGSDKEFDPLLLSVGPLEMSMNHLPAAQDTELVKRTLSVVLANSTLRGERFAATLEGENLAGARIEWAQLLVPPETLTQAGPRLDLTAYTGAELTYFFRGEVVRAAPITQDSITLQCATEYATAGFETANGAMTDPRDVGRRLPIVFGHALRVPAISYRVGGSAVLGQDIDTGTTGHVLVSDTSTFSAAFIAKLGSEEIVASVVDERTINITTRGNSGTTAQVHLIGDQLDEPINTGQFILAGHECVSVDRLYAKNFYGNLVEFFIGTVDLSDTAVISGLTVTSLTFSANDFEELYTLLSMRALDETESGGAALSTVTQAPNSVTVHDSNDNTYDAVVGNAGSTRLDGGGSATQEEWLRLTWAAGSATQHVNRWRLKATGSVTAANIPLGQDNIVEFVAEGFPGTEPGTLTQSTPNNSTNNFTNATGAWATPPAGTTMADLATSGLRVHMKMHRPATASMPAGDSAIYSSFVIEAEITSLAPLGGEKISIVNGFKLEIYSDVSGLVAPSASPAYEAGTGNLIEVPADVIRYWVEEVGGFSVDTTTLAAYAAEITAAMRFDARSLGATWASVLARLSFEGAVNLVPEEAAAGTVWKLLAPEFDGSEATFPAAAAEITAWAPGGFVEADADIVNQLRTRIAGFYGYEAWRGTDEDAFTKLRRVDPDTTAGVAADTEMEAAEDAYGRRDADPMFFITHAEDGDLDEAVLGYYAQEMSRAGRTYAIKDIPWWEGYALEPGDIRTVTVPWSGTSRKVRILSVIKDPVTEFVEIRALEVL